MASKKQWLLRGLRDGLPIGIGYFAVSFALGISAVSNGINAVEAGLMSILNLTSAGEAAAIAMLGMGTTYVELAFTQFVINLRYLLMSCALSQKIAPETSVLHRLLIGYGVTDEIFGISSSVEGRLSPFYSYGAILVAAPCWALGTVAGALVGNVMPASVVGALGVALYAMFLAIILPPARKSRVLAALIGVSIATSLALSALAHYLAWTWLTEGVRIILLTVSISLVFAILFPIPEENKTEVVA